MLVKTTPVINSDYSLNFNTFQTDNGIYTIVGTDGSARLAKDAIDEWRCGQRYIKISRQELLNRQNKGLIRAI